jgi:hypothetical protein
MNCIRGHEMFLIFGIQIQNTLKIHISYWLHRKQATPLKRLINSRVESSPQAKGREHSLDADPNISPLFEAENVQSFHG